MSFRKIIIEGVDKVGKTMLYKYLHNITKYKYYIQARGEISQEIYDSVYQRNTGFKAKIENDCLYILLTCSDRDELKFRLTFDPVKLNVDDILQQQKIFVNYFKKINNKQKLIFDISKDTLNKIGEKILWSINQK